ncbi:M28 family peptidase [Cytophagaceae bacterium ABcell3]|nr:M28 family peptidase [Cytophagaceae bacterium ABcell3]
MKSTVFFGVIFLLSHSFVYAQFSPDTDAQRYAETITAEELSEHLHILASDSLEGRETGTRGQKMAAEYIANAFERSGVLPGVVNDGDSSYFQNFDLIKKEWNEVKLIVNKREKVFLEDFYLFGDFDPEAREKMRMVFAGFGIETPEYSDYKDLDVEGKGVVIFMGEPVRDGISLITNTSEISDWAFDWRRKAALARDKGAREVFVVVGNSRDEFDRRLNTLKEHIAQPSLAYTHKRRSGSAFFIPPDLGAEMLRINKEELFDKREALLTEKPSDMKFKRSIVRSAVTTTDSIVNTENILGFIEGGDKKEEIIVLTAHYDHLGIENGKIYNGADDDGSGTVALIEIAEAFAMAARDGHRPRRSILIMPVTAEEKGLMGSEYYTDNPVFPLENTVTNLNIDMIGRLDENYPDNPDYVYLIGSDRLSTELHEVSENANDAYTNLTLDYRYNEPDDPNRFYYRSDHYNFAKNNIPIIFYFNGVHEDYHQPSDTVDKILFDKVENITKLVFYTAWHLANRENRVEVDVNEE